MTFSFKRIACSAIVSATVFFTALEPGVAQPPGGLSPDAQRALQRGYMAAKQAEWALAIRYFNKAYGFEPSSAETIYNLALAIDRSGRNAIKAMALYGKYLSVAPLAANAPLVRNRIAELEIKIEAEVLKLIDMAQSAVNALPDDYDRKYNLRKVATVLALTGNAEQAMALAPKGNADAVYQDIAEAQAELGQAAQALNTLRKITDKSDIPYAAYLVAKQLARHGKFTEAIEAAEQINKPDNSADAYIAIAEAHLKLGNDRNALEMAAIAESFAYKMDKKDAYDEYHEIAKVRAKAGDLLGAELAARKIIDTEKNYVEWAREAITESAFKERKWDIAFRNLKLIPQSELDLDSELDPIKDFFSNASVEQIAQGRLDPLLKQLQGLGPHPTIGALQVTLAKRYLDIGDTKRGRDLLQKALRNLLKVGKSYKAEEANKTLIKILAATGELVLARIHVSKIPDPDTKSEALMALAAEYAKVGDLKACRQLLDQARKASRNIKSNYDRMDILDDLVKAYAAIDKQGANQVIADMEQLLERDKELSRNTYRIIGKSLLRTGQVAKAMKAVAKIPDNWYRNDLLEDISDYHAKQGDFAAAKKVVAQMTGYNRVSELLAIEDDQRDLFRATRNAAHTRQEAERKIPSFKAENRVMGQIILAGKYARAGDKKSARALFHAALASSATIADLDTRASKLDSVENYINWNDRNLPLGHQVLQHMHGLARVVEKSDQRYRLREVSDSFTDQAQPHEAVSIALRIEDVDYRLNTLIKAALKLVQLGSKAGAKRLLQQIGEEVAKLEDMDDKIRKLAEIAYRHALLGEKELTHGAMERAAEMRQDGPTSLYWYAIEELYKAHIEAGAPADEFVDLSADVTERVGARIEVAKALIKKKQPDQARVLLQQAAELAGTIPQEPEKSHKRLAVAYSYLDLDDPEQAEAVVKGIAPHYLGYLYRRLASDYGKKGDKRAAARIAELATRATDIEHNANWERTHHLIYKHLGYMYGDLGDIAAVEKLVKREPLKGGKIEILASAGGRLAAKGDEENARKLLRKAWQLMGNGDSGFSDWLNYKLAAGCSCNCTLHDYRQGCEYLARIKDPYWKSKAYDSWAWTILDKEKDLDTALTEAANIPDPSAHDRFMRKVVDHYLKKPKNLYAALRAALAMTDAVTRDASLHDIAMHQAHSGGMEQALDTANNMSTDGRFWTLRAVAWAQFGEGDIDGAKHTLELAIDAIEAMADAAMRNVAVTSIKQTHQAWSSDGKPSTTMKPAVSTGEWEAVLSKVKKEKSLANIQEYLADERAKSEKAEDMVGVLLKAARERAAMGRRIARLAARME